MEEYLRWYVGMEPFYRILFLASVVVGLLAVVTGTATDNGLFFFVGLFWIVGGVAVIRVASRREAE